MELKITKANFTEEVLNSDEPVLVDFWASWCGPCKMLGPIVSEFASKHSDIKVGKVNVDEERELAMQYQIMSIPTMILFQDGAIARKHVGLADINTLERTFL